VCLGPSGITIFLINCLMRLTIIISLRCSYYKSCTYFESPCFNNIRNIASQLKEFLLLNFWSILIINPFFLTHERVMSLCIFFYCYHAPDTKYTLDKTFICCTNKLDTPETKNKKKSISFFSVILSGFTI